jgi:hypothetical protein
MEREPSIADIDDSLVARLATFSRGGQRWLKTAIQAIATTDVATDVEEEAPKKSGRRAKEPPVIEAPSREAASLEDVITGKADLRDHLEAYPELQEELDGLADVIDLLREAGEKRRKRGEQILREEILGPSDENPEVEDEEA